MLVHQDLKENAFFKEAASIEQFNFDPHIMAVRF